YDLINESWQNSHSVEDKAPPFEANRKKEHVTEQQSRLYMQLAASLYQKASAKRLQRMLIGVEKETADILAQHMNNPIHSEIQMN
ncbi:VLRF1 family aeRF1-type release factor, partial [Bacillus subtilis]